MREHNDSTTAASAAPEARGVRVTIFVPDDHPLLQLKRALDWEAITAVMVSCWLKAGKNVAAGRGRPWPVPLYVPLLVLMWLESLAPRKMEKYVSESVVARCFLDLTAQQLLHVRDHSSIARAEAAVDAESKAEINALIIKAAQETGFTDGEMLSSDTTVQEPAIGYPNEPGILRGLAQRIARKLKKLKERGVKGAQAGIEQAQELYRSVKAHHLFAKTKEAKQKMLAQILKQSEELIEQTKQVIKDVGQRCGEVKQKAAAKLQRLVEVSQKLIPQLKYWMKTGLVASGKIIHAGITQARAITRGKGRVKFGMKWRINRLKGGYLFGCRVLAHADENKMPAGALKDYRKIFGKKATPQMVVYDRGASLAAAASGLQAKGVEKVGIPPRGKGAWLVGEKDQQVVKSERGKTEGSIGRLKSSKYGFSHRQERSVETQTAAGQRAIVSANLNTLMRDLVRQAKVASLAQG